MPITKLTIAEAVKRSGVSRPTFNSRYIKTELVTVLKENGKQYIKAAELTKAINQQKKKTTPVKKAKPSQLTLLKLEIEQLQEEEEKLRNLERYI